MSLILGIFLSTIVWEVINIPYSNSDFVIGKLTIEQFNPLNNTLRFIIFIFSPSIFFYYFVYKRLKHRLEIIDNSYNEVNFLAGLTFVLLVIQSILFFLSKDFSTLFFDYFHEGLELLPAVNFYYYNSIWSDTLFIRGAFVDMFTTVFSWELLNVSSIGAYRYGVEFNYFLIELVFIFLVFSIWFSLNNSNLSSILLVLIYLGYKTTLSIQNLDRRLLLFLLGLGLIILSFRYKSKLILFLIGILSSTTVFFSLDTGIYYNVLLIFFSLLTYLLHPDKFRNEIIVVILGILTSWFGFIYFLGIREFNSFFDNFIYIIKYKDLLDSYIYPNPFKIENYRFLIPLVLSAINIMFCIFYYFYHFKITKHNLFLISLFMTFSSILIFRGALGRSDITHLEYSSTLIIISFIFNTGILVLNSVHNISKKFTVLLFFIFLIYLNYDLYRTINFKNVFNHFDRLKVFTNLPDESFLLNEKYLELEKLKKIFKDEECIFSLGNDALTPFILRKPSCNIYYLSYFASPKSHQYKYIEDLERLSPEYIVYSTNNWYQNIDTIENKIRIPAIMNYIEGNYSFYSTISNNWIIYRRN